MYYLCQQFQGTVTGQLHVRCPQHQRNQFSFILEQSEDFIDLGLVVFSKETDSDIALAYLRFTVWGITVTFEVCIDLLVLHQSLSGFVCLRGLFHVKDASSLVFYLLCSPDNINMYLYSFCKL